MSIALGSALPISAGQNIIFSGERLGQLQLTDAVLNDGHVSMKPDTRATARDTSGPAKDRAHFRSTISTGKLDVESFDQLVVSWNALCHSGSWLVVEARVGNGAGWSRWYNLGYWAADQTTLERTSIKEQKDERGDVSTDVLVLENEASSAEVRIHLCAMRPTRGPGLRLLALSFDRSKRQPSRTASDRKAWGTVLNVPEISQLSYPPKGGVWCSPTSVTMVMNYWASLQNRPEWKTDVRATAAGVFDKAWNGTGNWTFNTAFAGARPGLAAICMRLNSMEDVEQWVLRGVPVVLSISSDILHQRGGSGGGHLVVCVGFDDKGNPVVNDPYANFAKNQKVRRVYDRERLLQAWQNRSSLGASYIICPTEMLQAAS